MSTHQGLVVLSGGRRAKGGNFKVASEAMIMSLIGLYQIFDRKGISLNQLHKTLDRIREGPQRVDWYALRSTLVYLENDGQLKSIEIRGRSRLSGGKTSYRRWQLADWEVWWDVLRKQLL